MGIEIERKFLVTDDSYKKSSVISINTYFQAYIYSDEHKNIRVRIIDNEKAFLTIKYNKENRIRRQEFEYEIPLSDSIDMSINCTESLMKKRYKINYKNRIWEVDEYMDPQYNGLTIAEIELTDENQKFKKPKWIGDEITGIKKYSNCELAKIKTNIINQLT